MVITFVGLIVFVFDLIALVDVLQSPLSSGAKVLWALLILFFPVIGMVLYFVIGKNPA